MPDFVKCLFDIQEYSRSVFLIFYCVHYCMSDAVALLSRSVPSSKPKLVFGYNVKFVQCR